MKRTLAVLAVLLVAIPFAAEAKKKKKPASNLDDVPFVPIPVVKLTVQTAVNGAKVLIDDKVVGTTPLAPVAGLALGKHVLVVSRPGYKDYRSEVDLKAGDAKVVNVDLVPTAAFVTIRSAALGATAFIDGATAGGLPVLEKDVTPGTHSVEVKAPGLEPYSEKVTVKLGEVRVVEAALRPPGATPSLTAVAQTEAERTVTATTPAAEAAPFEAAPANEVTVQASNGITSKWWVWTAVGVVVVAAAATGTWYAVSHGGGGYVHQYPQSNWNACVNLPSGYPACGP